MKKRALVAMFLLFTLSLAGEDYRKLLDRTITAESYERTLLAVSSLPHPTGSVAQRDNTQYLAERMRKMGLQVEVMTFSVPLPEPRKSALYWEKPGAVSFPMQEPALLEDPFSESREALVGFNAWSPSGNVSGPLIFAHYGGKEEYEYLLSRGVKLKGAIALVRLGREYRGDKAALAKKYGLAGVLLFPDPQDRGFRVGTVYPEGNSLPAGGLERGSLDTLPYPGDPLTPGRPSLPGQKRLEKNPLDGELAVTLPISYETAQKLLTEMSGERAPEAWQGGLGTIYRTGDGVGAKVVMRVENKTVERAVYVVVGKIPGKSRPREVVALGSHFDAWVYGTTDPNAGTAVVMETAAFFADLAKSGWRPERTLAFVHWDGEEFGVIGSTEWEEELERRGERVVLTINEDAAVGGPDFGIVATPGHRSLLVRYVERFLKEYGRERFSLKIPQKFDVGAVVSCGSDHCAPLYRQNSGVFAFWSAGSYGVYHSLYDNPLYYQRFVDPGYLYGRDLSKILAGTLYLYMEEEGGEAFDGADLAEFLLGELASPAWKPFFEKDGYLRLKRALESLKGKPAWRGAEAGRVRGLFLTPQGAPQGVWARNTLYKQNPENRYVAWARPSLLRGDERAWQEFVRLFEGLAGAGDASGRP